MELPKRIEAEHARYESLEATKPKEDQKQAKIDLSYVDPFMS